MFTVFSTPTLTLPHQGGGIHEAIGQLLKIISTINEINAFPFVAFVGLEKERHIMGWCALLLLAIPEFLHGRPTLCRRVRNSQLLKKNTLTDLARVFESNAIVWKQRRRGAFACPIEFRGTALGKDDRIRSLDQASVIRAELTIREDDLSIGNKTGVKRKDHGSVSEKGAFL